MGRSSEAYIAHRQWEQEQRELEAREEEFFRILNSKQKQGYDAQPTSRKAQHEKRNGNDNRSS